MTATAEIIEMPNFDLRIQQLLQLRKIKKETQDRHKDELKPINDAMEELEGLLLTWLNQTGQQNAKTKSGTVYKTTKKSASLADPEAFMRFVIETEQWDLLDRKANVTACENFIAEHNHEPPGVNYRERIEVGVLSASSSKK